jgi:CheY-like chemotaxis protein
MADLSNYRILVVDDDPDTLVFISTLLADAGATILEARDGNEALEVTRREKPDLVTLDLAMPGKDGGQVFEKMRGDPELAEIPVFIISGKPELRRLIYQRTVRPPEGFLDKPIDEATLLLNIRKVLALSHRYK